MMDIHAHSVYSDGSATVREIVQMAKANRLDLCAITDHDGMDGTEESIAEGNRQNVNVISGMELNIAYECELHMLAYGFDWQNEGLKQFMRDQAERRNKRNQKILDRLEELGMPIHVHRDERGAMISRTHIADSLVRAGHAVDMQDAFKRVLGPGGSARIDLERLTPEDAIQLIHQAQGIAVLAHPGQLQSNWERTIRDLADLGLDGLEVYYAAHRASEISEFRGMALRYGLMMTTGSDYHGEYRKYAKYASVAALADRDPAIREAQSRLIDLAKKNADQYRQMKYSQADEKLHE